MRIFLLSFSLLVIHAPAQWPAPMSLPKLQAYADSSWRRDPHVHYPQDWESVLEDQSPFYAKLFPYLRKQNIYFYQYGLHFIDNHEALLAPVQRTPDGGAMVFAYRSKDKKGRSNIPYIVKYDSSLALQWERYYEKKGLGIQSYEVHGGGLCPDGKTYVALMRPYTDRTQNPMQWLLWLDSTGRIQHEAMLPGKGGPGTPSIHTLQMNAQCGLQMAGHIYLSEREQREEYWHYVFYKYNSRGVMLYDSIGPALKY